MRLPHTVNAKITNDNHSNSNSISYNNYLTAPITTITAPVTLMSNSHMHDYGSIISGLYPNNMITTNTNISTTANYNAYDSPNIYNTNAADRNLDILRQLQQEQHMHAQANANANINLLPTNTYAGLPRLGLLGNTNQGVDFGHLHRLNVGGNQNGNTYNNYAYTLSNMGATGGNVNHNNNTINYDVNNMHMVNGPATNTYSDHDIDRDTNKMSELEIEYIDLGPYLSTIAKLHSDRIQLELEEGLTMLHDMIDSKNSQACESCLKILSKIVYRQYGMNNSEGKVSAQHKQTVKKFL